MLRCHPAPPGETLTWIARHVSKLAFRLGIQTNCQAEVYPHIPAMQLENQTVVLIELPIPVSTRQLLEPGTSHEAAAPVRSVLSARDGLEIIAWHVPYRMACATLVSAITTAATNTGTQHSQQPTGHSSA